MFQPALRNIKTVDDTLKKIEALDQVQKRKDIRAEEAAVEAYQKLPEEKDENAPDLKVRLEIRLAPGLWSYGDVPTFRVDFLTQNILDRVQIWVSTKCWAKKIF